MTPFAPNPCPECKSGVAYHDKRKVCYSCRKWVHVQCIRLDETDRPFCAECRNITPEQAYSELVETYLPDYGETPPPDDILALKVVVSSFFAGPNETAIAAMTGLSYQEIQPFADALRRGNVWTEDKVVVGEMDTEDANSWRVATMLCVLTARGLVVFNPDKTISAAPSGAAEAGV